MADTANGKRRMQAVTLVLADGRRVQLIGPAFCEDDEIPTLSAVGIEVSPPRELGPGMAWVEVRGG